MLVVCILLLNTKGHERRTPEPPWVSVLQPWKSFTRLDGLTLKVGGKEVAVGVGGGVKVDVEVAEGLGDGVGDKG